LLMMLYGGREAYHYRNEWFKYIRSEKQGQNLPDLSLPEWERFLQLARQLLDAPIEVQRVPLILREVAFSVLQDDRNFSFAKTLCSETHQGARFAVLIANYM